MFTFPTGLFVPSQAGDPFWANVVFLQNFQGTNGSKPATDQSQYAHVLTWNGDAVISTAQSPFAGGSSVALDGTGDVVSWPSPSGASILSGDFTIEAFFYPSLLSGFRTIVGQWQQGVGLGGFLLVTNGSALGFYLGSFSEGAALLESGSPIVNTWNFAAVTRSGDNFSLILNNSVVGSATSATTRTPIAVNHTLATYYSFQNLPISSGFSGNLGPVRITKGIPRTIITPTAPFPTGP